MSCQGCGSCYFKKEKFVGSRGNIKASIVFVGESPGPQEILHGEPFVGPSGKVLEDQLKDLNPDEYYITNAIQCQPSKFGMIKGEFRELSTDEKSKNLSKAVNRCHKRLMDELSAYPRKVIVTLGNGALWALTNNHSHKITQIRGQRIKSELASYGIIPTVHPAFLPLKIVTGKQ